MQNCHSHSFRLLAAAALVWSAECGASTERIDVSGKV